MKMTDQQLVDIRKRCDKATKGPWVLTVDSIEQPDGDIVLNTDHDLIGFSAENDAEFCAHARTDIPLLLSEIDRLNAQLAEERCLTIRALEEEKEKWNRLNNDLGLRLEKAKEFCRLMAEPLGVRHDFQTIEELDAYVCERCEETLAQLEGGQKP